MDQLLIAKLNEYCDNLLGEKTDPKPSKVKTTKKSKSTLEETAVLKAFDTDDMPDKNFRKKKKSKKKTSLEKCDFNDHDSGVDENHASFQLNENGKDICDDTEPSVISADVEQDKIPALVTEDGFKIVSLIPEDDSDVSDAFESDLEEDEDILLRRNSSKGSEKTTDDGFRIVSEIAPDDSDVSDAFTDDGDCNDMGEDLIMRRKELGETKSLNKHMLEMIDEFGIGENIINKKEPENKKLKKDVQKMVSSVRNSKKRKRKKKYNGLQNTITLAAKQKPPVDVTVYDYTNKKDSNNSAAVERSELKQISMPNTKEELEREMKKMRFEIFKLGMGGFSKEKKKETRVALAIKLGAKPRKNKHVSYKDLLVMKKNEKIQKKAQQEMEKEMGIKDKKKAKPDLKEKKRKPRAYSSQVGRYKDGVLSLSKKDLHKIKNS
ncbi:uncharacterized protein C1orf131 homolog [Palaemon carinicauda]|uniref:uncharacterized protein C1orf131 homolog n=1 Tax=Palaemon carinicauda TaxID=392227 RepID=UPI0035B5F33D